MMISGAIGLGIGLGICFAFNHLPLPDVIPHPVISPAAIIASLVTLGLITVGGGSVSRTARRGAESD